MSRALITIRENADRNLAARWAAQVPVGTRIEFKAMKRSLDQNSKLWACLTDVASQLEWHGQRLTTNDWKLIFLDALKQESRLVPSIDGSGVVSLGKSSSDLSKEEMTELLELILAFGANHGVVFRETASGGATFHEPA